MAAWSPQVLSELASVNIRLFAFAAELSKRGHTALVADVDHFHQVGPRAPRIRAFKLRS